MAVLIPDSTNLTATLDANAVPMPFPANVFQVLIVVSYALNLCWTSLVLLQGVSDTTYLAAIRATFIFVIPKIGQGLMSHVSDVAILRPWAVWTIIALELAAYSMFSFQIYAQVAANIRGQLRAREGDRAERPERTDDTTQNAYPRRIAIPLVRKLSNIASIGSQRKAQEEYTPKKGLMLLFPSVPKSSRSANNNSNKIKAPRLVVRICSSPSMMQIANPASVYCVQQGGTLEIVKDKDGNEIGMCRLPDGTVREEWDFFRSSQPQDESNSAQLEDRDTGASDAPALKQA
ncbi:uncharacterized protein PAN0_005c2478 [Moesziomyces antarcticus]|uniref:DUF333 domain-containing protein n=1 Tax=Pseudozyma antarctica TaxID=84753 RepID=A0A081CC70_PSEA2|nr:uncharacterized protein PAN0_005c2478 [Moesziomyces antarcticus]GAK64266.1 conserved hypothetical protein [Moesziomyces antarcticus]